MRAQIIPPPLSPSSSLPPPRSSTRPSFSQHGRIQEEIVVNWHQYVYGKNVVFTSSLSPVLVYSHFLAQLLWLSSFFLPLLLLSSDWMPMRIFIFFLRHLVVKLPRYHTIESAFQRMLINECYWNVCSSRCCVLVLSNEHLLFPKLLPRMREREREKSWTTRSGSPRSITRWYASDTNHLFDSIHLSWTRQEKFHLWILSFPPPPSSSVFSQPEDLLKRKTVSKVKRVLEVKHISNPLTG